MSTTTPTPRDLRARADSLADQARTLRRDLREWQETKLTEVGIARDRAAREQYAAEQSAKSADIQVKREKADVARLRKEAADLEAKALAAEKKGDLRAAEELREQADDFRNSVDIHAARARQAELDAVELREEAAHHARRVVELETEKADLIKDGSAAFEQVDRVEDQARLLDEAATKLTNAELLKQSDASGVDTHIPEIATLELAAEKALLEADDIEIDPTKITDVLPDARIETEAVSSTEADAPVTDTTADVDPTADDGHVDPTDGDAGGILDTEWLEELIEESGGDAEVLPGFTPVDPDLADSDLDGSDLDGSDLAGSDLSDVDSGRSDIVSGLDDTGLGYDDGEVAFADTAAATSDDSFDDSGTVDDFA